MCFLVVQKDNIVTSRHNACKTSNQNQENRPTSRRFGSFFCVRERETMVRQLLSQRYCYILLVLCVCMVQGVTGEIGVDTELWNDDLSSFFFEHRRLGSVDPCEPDGPCEVCSSGLKGPQDECAQTGNIQKYQCEVEGALFVFVVVALRGKMTHVYSFVSPKGATEKSLRERSTVVVEEHQQTMNFSW